MVTTTAQTKNYGNYKNEKIVKNSFSYSINVLYFSEGFDA